MVDGVESKLDELIKLFEEYVSTDQGYVGRRRFAVGTSTVTEFFPPGRSWTIRADNGNTDFVYVGFGPKDATSSEPNQGVPLNAGESMTDVRGKYRGRMTFITGTGSQIIWVTADIGLLFSKGQISKVYGDNDAMATGGLDAIQARMVAYDRFNAQWLRKTAWNGARQTSAANAVNTVTLTVFDSMRWILWRYTRSAATWTGSRTLSVSLDNFGTTDVTADSALPAGAITTAAEAATVGEAAQDLADLSAAVLARHMLAFPYIRSSLPAQGAGVTTTTAVSVK